VQRYASLLALASEEYAQAVREIGIDGRFEREVEDAAAACWGTAEKIVQVRLVA